MVQQYVTLPLHLRPRPKHVKYWGRLFIGQIVNLEIIMPEERHSFIALHRFKDETIFDANNEILKGTT